MMFKSLEVENFGAFSGKNFFNLKTNRTDSKNQSVIIFGGKNGTGKTTLLEAVKICLYGNSFKGKKMPKGIYQKYLRQRLHRTVNGKISSQASVSVEFDYAHSGHANDYLVKRSWKVAESELFETLEIRQNGESLQDVDEEQWQDFLMELIPQGLSKLFFFDGEKIQNLAKGIGENRHILTSINSLLGIDLVEHLQNDLRIYNLRRRAEKSSEIEVIFKELSSRKNMLAENYESILQTKASQQTKISRIIAEIEDQERQISMEGGGYANKREQLRLEEKKLDETVDLLREEIRELCASLLPFSFIPESCAFLQNRLEQEEKEQQRIATLTFLRNALKDLTKDLDNMNYLDSFSLTQEQRHAITTETVNELRNRIEKMNGTCKEILHPLSSVERNEMLRWISMSLNHIPIRLAELTARLKKLESDKEKIDDFLFRAPSDDVLRPLFVKLGQLHEELGMLQQKQKALEEEAIKVKNDSSRVTHELSKVLEEKRSIDKLSRRLKLASRAQKVLEEYLQELRTEKVAEFRQNFLDCFNLLFGKKDFIQNVSVDQSNFNITLTNAQDVIIPKTELSAGEKQVYAIALLWALARTSGRQLPFIIDTPLGRLDIEHRTNMMRYFLPSASNQMIVFSTNTEIDQFYFNQLQPYISKAYQLEYDVTQGSTRIKEGYFRWTS